MRTGKGYLFRAGYSEGVSLHHVHLAETQRQAEKWESFLVKKSGVWPGEAGGGLPRSGVSMRLIGGLCRAFTGWS